MIITCPKIKRGEESSPRNLMYYIAAPDKKEKTLCVGSINMLADDKDLEEQVIEMEELSAANPRCKTPVFHSVMSFMEGEVPTREQCGEAVKMYMKELGMDECEAFWGLHQNTDNMHIHVFINRVHPQTFRRIYPDFYKKANERAARKIEIAQGWNIVRAGRYEVVGGEVIERPRDDSQDETALPKGAKDFETQTGEKSVIRQIRENGTAMTLLFKAESWKELHEGLYKSGMKIEKVGSGGAIVVRFPEGEKGVKLSSVGKKISMARLEKRLGGYVPYQPRAREDRQLASAEPSASQKNNAPSLPETRHEGVLPTRSYERYKREKDVFYAEKKKTLAGLKEAFRREREELREKQRRYRREYFKAPKGTFHGKGVVLNALRSVVADEQIVQRERLKLQQKRRYEDYLQFFGRKYPSFKEWLKRRGNEEEAEQWRYRATLPGILSGAEYNLPLPDETEMGAYATELARVNRKTVVNYYDKRKDNRLAFVDTGRLIRVQQSRDRDAVLAALKLASQKCGAARVTGSDEFKKLVARLAAENGFTLKNPELQARVEEIRKAREAERKAAEELRKKERTRSSNFFWSLRRIGSQYIGGFSTTKTKRPCRINIRHGCYLLNMNVVKCLYPLADAHKRDARGHNF